MCGGSICLMGGSLSRRTKKGRTKQTNEYVPADLQTVWDDAALRSERRNALQVERNTSVQRELIRALIYSPQVIIGRQSLVNDKTLIELVSSEEDQFNELLSQGRILCCLPKATV